jgi:acetamidase/formamidase
MMTEPRTHVLKSTEETVSPGVLDPARSPALTIDSGDVVVYPDTWTQWGNQARFGMSFADREPLRHQYPNGPYSNVGPVEVRGAQPGDVLEPDASRQADRLGLELVPARGRRPAEGFR